MWRGPSFTQTTSSGTIQNTRRALAAAPSLACVWTRHGDAQAAGFPACSPGCLELAAGLCRGCAMCSSLNGGALSCRLAHTHPCFSTPAPSAFLSRLLSKPYPMLPGHLQVERALGMSGGGGSGSLSGHPSGPVVEQ
jgi:hypothetical protein